MNYSIYFIISLSSFNLIISAGNVCLIIWSNAAKVLRIMRWFKRPACMKTWRWPFYIMIFALVISNNKLKYSILLSYLFKKESCVNLVIWCVLYSDSFTNKLIYFCPQVARGLVYTIDLELDHEQISYITSNIFTCLTILWN